MRLREINLESVCSLKHDKIKTRNTVHDRNTNEKCEWSYEYVFRDKLNNCGKYKACTQAFERNLTVFSKISWVSIQINKIILKQ